MGEEVVDFEGEKGGSFLSQGYRKYVVAGDSDS